MAQKFIIWDAVNKVKKLLEAITTSAGSADAGKIIGLDPTGKLDSSFMPVGIGADTWAIIASEDLSAGDFVNVYDNGGALNVRKADASDPAKFATGYILDAVTSGNNATVYVDKKNDQLSGLSAGKYWLDTTAGGITQTPPTTAGYIVQQIGVSMSDTELNVEVGEVLVLA